MKKTIVLVLAFLIVSMLAIPAGAASFTPSVEQKGAPDLGTMKDTSGKNVAVIVTDAEGKEILGAPTGSVKVTPLAEIKKATKEEQAVMNDAYQSLSNKKGLEAAAPALKEALAKINQALSEKLAQGATVPAPTEAAANAPTEAAVPAPTEAPADTVEVPNLTIGDLVVRDLVHVSVKNNVQKSMVEGGGVRLKFDMQMKPEEVLIVMVFVKGEWVVIDDEMVVIEEDGSVTVTFGNDLGPVAFVVPKTDD